MMIFVTRSPFSTAYLNLQVPHLSTHSDNVQPRQLDFNGAKLSLPFNRATSSIYVPKHNAPANGRPELSGVPSSWDWSWGDFGVTEDYAIPMSSVTAATFG
jgi:hypothetical protein